ncbi:MAG: F0F1 ATP synthase subunit B, partial [Nitrosospira sp.]
MNINFTLFSQAMAFAIFIWFTVRFVWPPLMRAIENRQRTIADGLAAGERGKQELELASHRSADVVREAKQRATDIIAQAEKRAS